MVSPLQSIIAQGKAPANPGMALGDIIRRQQMTDSTLRGQQLQQQLQQQQLNQGAQRISSEQALGSARYINALGKQLLSTDESQWQRILAPNIPQLQQIGFNPEQLRGMTRQDIEAVVAQTEPVIGGQLGQGRAQSKTANIQDFEYYNELKKTNPAGAEMFAKDVGLIPKDSTLSATAEKSLISAQEDFMRSTAKAREYELLANDFERFKSELPVGTSATVGEFIKSVTGSQDEASELRRRFQSVRLSQALKNLPPGPATDKDVSEAMKGVPKDTASVEQITSFLRGAAKIEAIESEFQEFKADYISQNNNTKGLIVEWKRAIEAGEIESVNALEEGGSTAQAAPAQQPQIIKFDAQGNQI